ncbi:MAG: hypothetical protein U0519_03645 [Candidatus Gracilibacteria bacterium]
MYKELSTGKISEDPTSFDVVPPVTTPPEEGGCSVSTHVGSTRNDLNAILLAIGAAAAVMRRRKQD